MDEGRSPSSKGVLHVVGTPIGNLGDLTERAKDALRSADRVYAEDTRRARALLSHLGIAGKPIHRFDAHAEVTDVAQVLGFVEQGEQVALVSDAGMPVVSDPGAALVRAIAERALGLDVLPGPSAVTTAVALSGLVTGPFLFLGFLPRKGEKRRSALQRIARSAEPVVLFEAANRARDTLAELAELDASRAAVVCRELTKLHQEVLRGSVSELSRVPAFRGELTLVIDRAPEDETTPEDAPDDDAIAARIGALLAEGKPTKVIASELHAWSRLPRRELYSRVQEQRARDAEDG